MKDTLASDRYTTPALVRGVYWSSVVQQGDMLNAFVREAAQPYKAKLPLLEGKAQGKALAYFINTRSGVSSIQNLDWLRTTSGWRATSVSCGGLAQV